ncbi:MAG: hypothetical protein KAH57_04730 [Thermoplasmata archaeon]|nr:hypothetical protein [Thermoplasmata archaeon]
MKWPWPLVLLMILPLIVVFNADGSVPRMQFDEDYYEISVDPSDPYQGVLEIDGSITMDLNIGETATITLTSNITEYDNDVPTGRYWSSIVYFDGGVENNVKVFSRLDNSANIVVELDPLNHNPGTDLDIPVPPGLSPDTEGRGVVTASYTGAYEGEISQEVTIYPMEYTLINLTTGTDAVEVTAGERLDYTLSIKNAGNLITSCYLEVPTLSELSDEGWETTLDNESFVDLLPGEERKPHLILVAPDDIRRNSREELEITLKTYEIDPGTGEPTITKTLWIQLDLIESNRDGPINGDDEPVDNSTVVHEDDGTSSVVLVIAIIIAVGAVAGVLILMLVKNKGDEDDDLGDNDHSSLFRI